MVAKIGRGENLMGALSYNQLKVDKENGQVLFTHKMLETPNGRYSAAQLYRSFEPYLVANRRTEKPVLHISLNPDPKDKVSDHQFNTIAQEYMQTMGYGEQPFVVFKHTDIERTHIHIVSVCVDEEGRKISDKFEKRKSMDVCRDLEKKYNLIPATKQENKKNNKVFRPVDYKAGDIKGQMTSVVRHLPKYYRFQSLGAYNALLSLFNIRVEEVNGTLNGQSRQGLVYFALNGQNEKASNPFKASLFGKHAGYIRLQEHFEKSKESFKSATEKTVLNNTIEVAMHIASNEASFKKHLLQKGINTVVRRNSEGRVYGITFIDHTSKSVWNGSQLGKNLSANVFNDLWNQSNNTGHSEQETITPHQDIQAKEETHGPNDLFHFLDIEQTFYVPEGGHLFEAFTGLLPEAQGEDYEAMAFAHQMKKKKKRKKKQ